MTNATIHRQYQPGRSPLLVLAAIAATAATLSVAVLLPAQSARNAAIAAAQPAHREASTQIVVLPAVEVVGTRETQSAHNNPRTLPPVFKENG